jgi:hypothetical protein
MNLKKLNLRIWAEIENKFNNALATLASMVMINYRVTMQPICIKVKSSQTHYFSVDTEIDGKPW